MFSKSWVLGSAIWSPHPGNGLFYHRVKCWGEQPDGLSSCRFKILSAPFVLSMISWKKKIAIYDISNVNQNWKVFWFFELAELWILLWIYGGLSHCWSCLLVFTPMCGPSHIDHGCGHLTCLGQQNSSRCVRSRGLIDTYKIGCVHFESYYLEVSCHALGKFVLDLVISQVGRGSGGWETILGFSVPARFQLKVATWKTSALRCEAEGKPRRMGQLNTFNHRTVINNRSLSFHTSKFCWGVLHSST